MPCNTAAEQREYQRKWMQQRRQQALQYLGGVCASCGTTEDLEFDHVDPQTKVRSVNSLLSYRWECQLKELNKCQLLCSHCHQQKSKGDGSFIKNRAYGMKLAQKLIPSDVMTIRTLLNAGVTQQVLANQFGVNRSTISRIGSRKIWKRV